MGKGIEKIEVIEKKDPYVYYEKVVGKTPSGGDYSEAHYFDDNRKYVHKSKATSIIIRECKANGDIIIEHYMIKE
jgi:hypothetical protein